MMANEAFRLCVEDAELCEFIERYARRRCKRDRDRQQDLKQIGWMCVALCEAGKDTDYYIAAAQRGMYDAYRREYLRREYALDDEELMSRAVHNMWSRGVA